jgi:hypothetical protein
MTNSRRFKSLSGERHYSGFRSFVSVMRALCPAHPRLACREQDVDDRDKPGHDDL